MILELYMKNCALVEESRVNLGENLNILTGETGSGKSIMIEALGLCLGNKYDKSFLRKGTEKGIAEIIVSSPSKNLKNILNEYEIDLEDDQLIITRIIYADGKSVARINGRTIKMSILKEIALTFIDLHGQHQNQALFRELVWELVKLLLLSIVQRKNLQTQYFIRSFHSWDLCHC